MRRDETLDTRDLPPAWRDLAERLLTPAGRRPRRPFARALAPGERWRITLDQRGRTQTYTLELAAIDSDQVDILDEMRAAILERLSRGDA